jgi:type IV secretory pathway component VirB8
MAIRVNMDVKSKQYVPFVVTVERENQKGENVVIGRATVTPPSRG